MDDPAGEASEVARTLVASIVAYQQTHEPAKAKTLVAVRTVEDAQALAGVDFLLAPVSVLERLSEIPTMVGYNDGISGGASSLQPDEVPPILKRAGALHDKVKSAVGDGHKVREEGRASSRKVEK